MSRLLLSLFQGTLNTLRPRQMDAISQTPFSNVFSWIPIKISLKFVPKGLINNIPAMVQIMAWRRPGDKPLSEPMMVGLPTHICVARPQWVKKHPSHTSPSWARYRVSLWVCSLTYCHNSNISHTLAMFTKKFFWSSDNISDDFEQTTRHIKKKCQTFQFKYWWQVFQMIR